MRNAGDIVFGLFVLLCTVVVFLGAVGWVMNMVAFVQCDFQAPYKAEVLRGLGVFVPPVGVIEGWITIKDGEPCSQ
jgi:hypothetical protein